MARVSTEDQIEEVIATSLYRSGSPWSVHDMLKHMTTIKHASRLQEVCREMHSRGIIKSNGLHRNETYQRAGHKWLRVRWISEVAETLRDGDIVGRLTGQAARDACRRARALEGAGEETCGDSV